MLFLNDNPNVPQADDFRDYRNVADILEQWTEFKGDKDTQALIESAQSEFETWRVDPTSVA